MAQTKFFRGVDEASLPSTKRDGAIYIIDPGSTDGGRGKMFVDIGAKRLEISSPLSPVEFKKYTKNEITNPQIGGLSSSLGTIYLITEFDENQVEKVVGFKIGDGNAYLRDLPLNTPYTEEDIQILENLRDKVIKIENNGFSVNVDETIGDLTFIPFKDIKDIV